MKPKSNPTSQFRFHFHQILNLDHEFCHLAKVIDWPRFDVDFATCYSEDMGRPGNAIRLIP